VLGLATTSKTIHGAKPTKMPAPPPREPPCSDVVRSAVATMATVPARGARSKWAPDGGRIPPIAAPA
jgi:hypothetical protein